MVTVIIGSGLPITDRRSHVIARSRSDAAICLSEDTEINVKNTIVGVYLKVHPHKRL
jgi:hypothetical protein